MIDAEVFDSVKCYILTDLCNVFDFATSAIFLDDFLKKERDESYSIRNDQQGLNIYKDGDLEIEVSTVHAVKGETHAATLFLETKNYKYESEHFGAQLCGEPYKHRDGEGHVLPSLKVAYVALSRAKYMLVYAIKKDRFENLDRGKLDKIWDVEEIG